MHFMHLLYILHLLNCPKVVQFATTAEFQYQNNQNDKWQNKHKIQHNNIVSLTWLDVKCHQVFFQCLNR